jgi:protease-4
VLKLGGLDGAGLSSLQDVAAAIERFKAEGKRVVAVGDFYTQNQYYLAAHADEVYLHPQGFVFLPGYGSFHTYYRSAIDKVLVDWNVFKVGEYKSFVEPFLRDDMSPEARANAIEWLNGLWSSYQHDVTTARGLEGDTAGTLRAAHAGADEGDRRRPGAARAGDGAGDRRLGPRADGIAVIRARRYGRDESHVQSGASPRLPRGHARREPRAQVQQRRRRHRCGGRHLDGQQPPGTIGSDSISALVRQARNDEHVKAVVLRVDSGGGSAFASEVIGRELELLRESGKPLVTSMGSVAASGGYWISMPATEIWASPDSITGSIGIGAYFPTAQRTLDKLGIHVDGVGTTPLSGDFRADRALGDEAREILQLGIQNGYQRFISKVSAARNMPVERVDEIARGRVWLGEQAQQLGLVDKLGNLKDAIESAATLAGVHDDYRVQYIEREPSFRDAVAMQLANRAAAWLAHSPLTERSPVLVAADRLQRELARLVRWNDPRGLYYQCLCEVR